ncbi:hypothetical protein OHA71_06015 [Streptomyces sp. NBC_00444]|uniref:hypothetical protein n=1 Tax=Streptomyces sp. NBC_00444 TaxID=2975744 RepID=UPI002E2506C1
MPDHDPSPNASEEASRHVLALPRANAIAATIVALATLAATIVILILVTDDSGKAAAGAVSTTGLALAARLASPSR